MVEVPVLAEMTDQEIEAWARQVWEKTTQQQ
jgi:hypothetical protein